MDNYFGEIHELKQLNKNKILYLLFNSYPSSIVRGKIYRKYYEKYGYFVEYKNMFSPFLDNIITITNGKIFIRIVGKIFSKIQSFYVKSRLKYILRITKEYDFIFVIKSSNPEFIKNLKKSTNAKIVYDYDDAIWLPYFFGENVFKEIISSVDFVTCDNSYLKNKAMEYNKHSFVVYGSAQVELAISSNPHKNKSNTDIVLGWIGSPSTLFYLYSIYDALEALGAKYANVKLLIVGSGTKYKSLVPPFEKIRCHYIPKYSSDDMFSNVKKFDIGLYPLYNNEMSLGRGFLKATIYMSAGIPIVLSKLGANIELVQDGVNGFLASNTDEWVSKISLLIENSDLRLNIAKEAANTVDNQFTTEKCFLQIKNQILGNN